jgi:threonine/homoserine efflux transporter RhtA
MKDSSRTQGALICVAAVVLGAVFLGGLLNGAWWSVAIPVGVLLAFVLGLTFWVGWTIATIQVEPESDADAPGPAGPESDADVDARDSAGPAAGAGRGEGA